MSGKLGEGGAIERKQTKKGDLRTIATTTNYQSTLSGPPSPLL